MNVSIVFSILLAVAFVAAAIGRVGGLPGSISAMVWLLPKGGWRWLWTIWLWVVVILLAPALIDLLPDDWKFLGFLAVSCLGFCGTMPVFMEDKHKAHNILGVAGGILSQVCVAFISPLWLMAWLLFVAALVVAAFPDNPWAARIIRIMHGKGVFLAEVVCAIAVYGALLT